MCAYVCVCACIHVCLKGYMLFGVGGNDMFLILT